MDLASPWIILLLQYEVLLIFHWAALSLSKQESQMPGLKLSSFHVNHGTMWSFNSASPIYSTPLLTDLNLKHHNIMTALLASKAEARRARCTYQTVNTWLSCHFLSKVTYFEFQSFASLWDAEGSIFQSRVHTMIFQSTIPDLHEGAQTLKFQTATVLVSIDLLKMRTITTFTSRKDSVKHLGRIRFTKCN